MRAGRVGLAAVMVLGALAAAEPPRSVSVADVCGDILAADVDGELHSAQPADWARNDVAALTVTEVTDEEERLLGVDLLVTHCADAREADRHGERVIVRWPLDERCEAMVDVVPDTPRTDLGGGTSVRPGPGGPKLSVSCFEHPPAGIGSQVAAVAIDPEAVSRDGRTLRVALRRDALGDLASLLAEGTTIAASVDSYALVGATMAPSARIGAVTAQVYAGTADRTAATPPLSLGG